MSAALIVVCPHCHAPNRVPAERLGAGGTCGKCKQPLFDHGREIARQAGAMDTANIVRWVKSAL